MKKTRFLLSVFMAIVMIAMSPAKSWAQDVTIGNGTSGVTYYPYNNYEKTSSSVMCYTSAELRGGTITSIAFRVCSASQLATNFVKVYMADTDITSLTTTLDVASISFTEVYSGNPTLGAATGWEPLALTTSFNHNKQKNLLVAVCRSSSRYNGGLTYYYHTTGTNYSIYCGGNDESNADITSSTNTYYAWNGWRPDTRFTFTPCTTHQGIYHAAVAPNCTTDGTVAHWQCDVCGKYFSDENCTSELASIVDPKLGHDLDAEKYCSRCEQTITQLDGTPFNLANYNNTIDVFSDHFISGPVNQSYTGNLIFTGNGSQMINLKQMPANGKFALRDATITLNSPAIFSLATDNEVVIEGDVKITTNNGALYGTGTSPNLDVTGPGNLSISGGSSAAIESCFNNLNIDIEGDLKLAGDAFFSGTCNGEIKVNAKSITANCNGSRPFFYYAFKATLHAKGDILLESTSTTNDSNISYDKIWCFKGIESDEGTVLMRMGKGGGHESVGVKVGYAGIPDVSDGNSYVSAFTWKVVDKTTGTATYYGGDPRSFGGISGTSAYDVYLSLVKDSEGNTVFDMENLYNSPINLYDGYFKNDQFNNICWEGHPVFTGTATGRRFLQFFETLSAANTPILRDLTFNTVSSCLQAPTGIDVAATIDGNVSMSCSDIAINVTNSCTITGDGSLTLNGSGNIYSCSDLNIDITGDLVGSTTSSGAPLYDHSFDFTKLHANSITFRGNTGTNNEHAIIMPTPATTPAASDPSITYIVKGEHKDGYTIWFADYETLASCSETVVPTFDSLQELIAAGQDYDAVNVTIEEEVQGAMSLEGRYIVGLKNSEITLFAPGSDLGWVSGGTVTGTLTKVAWNNTDKRLSGKDADFWSGLTYTAPSADNVPTFASIDELLAADIESGTTVTVTINGTIAEAKYISASSAYMVKLDNGFVLGGLFCVTSDPEWEVGGTVSGTLENVPFLNEDGEPGIMSIGRNIFAPGAGLDYTAPVVPEVTIGETKIAIALNEEGKYETTTPIVLTDGASFSATVDFYAPKVSYTRDLSSSTSKWGTIMLPFEVSSDEKVQYYDVSEVNLTEGVMTATPVETVAAGHPCLFKRLDEGNLTAGSSEKILISKSTTNGNISSSWTLVGTYSAITLNATATSDDYYYISADKFWHATGTVDVKPYRAYFIGEAPASEARAISIVVEEDGTSSIEAVMDVDGNIYDASEAAFDLSGRRISEGQRGLQIKNGRVVMMK